MFLNFRETSITVGLDTWITVGATCDTQRRVLQPIRRDYATILRGLRNIGEPAINSGAEPGDSRRSVDRGRHFGRGVVVNSWPITPMSSRGWTCNGCFTTFKPRVRRPRRRPIAARWIRLNGRCVDPGSSFRRGGP